MRNSFGIEAVSLAAAVDLDYVGCPPDTPRKADLVFAGSMAQPPNSDGVNYLVREILPRLWQRMPNCTLAVVGWAPSSVVLAVALEDFRIHLRSPSSSRGRCRLTIGRA